MSTERKSGSRGSKSVEPGGDIYDQTAKQIRNKLDLCAVIWGTVTNHNEEAWNMVKIPCPGGL